jgi:xanthine dehydrogenase accessory factor
VREVLDQIVALQKSGERVAMGIVIRTWQSAPRPAGAAMLVTLTGEAIGSVSGGCVEGAVYESALEVLQTGRSRLERYGVSDDDAFAVGLTCGGTLEVLVTDVSQTSWPHLEVLADFISADKPVAVALITQGASAGEHLILTEDERFGTLGSRRLDDAVCDDALGLLVNGRSATLHYGRDGERRGDEVEIFVHSFAPKARMYVFGAIDFAAALARLGSFLGYHVTICDARATFATTKRFPEADEVIVEWPHVWLARQEVTEQTIICVLTHDPKFDVPVLELALRSRAAYVGAMGSRRTHHARLEALRAVGMSEEELSRLHSPIGLDLGSRTPEETAISIAAEIIAHQWGGTGEPLVERDGPIHREDL